MSIHLTPQACSTAHNSQNRCWRLWRILSVACLGKLQARRIRTDVCTRSLPLDQERDLLEQALRHATFAIGKQSSSSSSSYRRARRRSNSGAWCSAQTSSVDTGCEVPCLPTWDFRTRRNAGARLLASCHKRSSILCGCFWHSHMFLVFGSNPRLSKPNPQSCLSPFQASRSIGTRSLPAQGRACYAPLRGRIALDPRRSTTPLHKYC